QAGTLCDGRRPDGGGGRGARRALPRPPIQRDPIPRLRARGARAPLRRADAPRLPLGRTSLPPTRRGPLAKARCPGREPMSTWTEETCPDLDATAPLGVASVDVATEELTRVLPQAAPSWVLVAVGGPEAGRRIDVGAGKTSVGRGVRCDVRLEDPAVSRMHLWLEGCDEGVRFEEACVKNGTRLEGRPCA